MNKYVYNLSMIAGVILVGVGLGLIKMAYGLIGSGSLIILLTVFAANMSTKDQN